MKKLIFSLMLAGISLMNAQEKNSNPFIYDEVQTSDAEQKSPTGPGDPQPAPIDDYLPALAVAAVGIAALYGRRRILS